MNSKLYNFIHNELILDTDNIKTITKLNGLNNLCYKVEYLNKDYFIRIYDNKINSCCLKEEKNTVIICSKNDIAPKPYYFSTKTGNMVTKWIDGISPSEKQFSSDDFISKLTDKLKILHSLKGNNIFNPFYEIRNNLARCKSLNLPLPSYIDILINKLRELEDYCLNNMDYGFCHNDLNPSNFIIAENNLYIIDYEFSGYGDIFFDLATLSWMMSNEGREMLLRAYFKTTTEYHYKKLSYYTFIVKFWNATWSLLKSQSSDCNYDYKKGAEIIFDDLFKSSFNLLI